ncbi:MAG: serine/threonine protein kinase [Cocleimonas sp.]|nr:serine/threonine protein kinase [Cocleimonas sp.]
MSLSLLLIQNNLVQGERIPSDMLSLLATKIPNANTSCASFSQLREGEIDVGDYELIITQDKFVKRRLDNHDVGFVVRNIMWKKLSDLSLQLDVFVQLNRYLSKYPLTLENWTLTEVLHDSDEAVIYRAENKEGGLAAIKRFKFKPSHLSDKVVQQFLSHIEKQCSLYSKGLVRFYDGGVSGEAFYLVMEYMQHTTLRQSLISCGEVLPLTHALEWFHEIVEALDIVHKAGLIHRDLKIDNIMLRGDGSLALMDYGVSKRILLDAGFVMEHELHCSPHYVSPEQISGDACTQASDIYSLGVIFYELLMGCKPYSASQAHELMMHHVMAPVPVFPDNLKQFQLTLNKMMAKDPDDRFSSVIDAVESLPVAA